MEDEPLSEEELDELLESYTEAEEHEVSAAEQAIEAVNDNDMESNAEEPDQDPSNASPSGQCQAPDELTQRYLKLLNAGRLASRKKFDLQHGGNPAAPTAGTRREAAAEHKPGSVHKTELARLTATAGRMDVDTLSRSTRLSSSPDMPRRHPQSAESTFPNRSSPSRVSQLTASAPATPFKKVLTPGPGSYDLQTDRFGKRDGSKFSFGSAQQRPPHVCIFDNVVSPGPVYMPQRDYVSTTSSSPRLMFGRKDLGSRFSLHASMPSNCPHWNPGPGDYEAQCVYKGGRVEPGTDVPRTVFGKSQKLVAPQDRFSATVFLSEAHAKKENACVHSPGPASYNPDESITRLAARQHTIAAKSASYFDAFLDPSRQPSPGPIYHTSHITHKGGRPWGDDPKTTFGRAKKQWEPEVSLSASAFITKEHAMHANQTVHSPGPVYFPVISHHVQGPHLASGPADRFYDRFEPGRVG